MASSKTKERILEALREGPHPADALARRLGLSRVAVERHLRELYARGLAHYEVRKNGGRGRPKRYWRAIEDRALCLEFCSGLLTRLQSQIGEEAAFDLLVAVQEERIRGVQSPEALLTWLSRRGYRPRLAGRVLEQGRCPRVALAKDHPELCRAEAEAYARALGMPVRLAERIPDGAPACRFVLGE